VPLSDLRARARGARAVAQEAAAYARLTRDLPPFLRTPLDPETALARLQRALATREQRLAWLVERGVYARPTSPFARLLRHAGCELGDFRALLCREGVEGALGVLADRGVYVTFDEVKGRREAVRGSARFAFRGDDFDNPLFAPHLAAYTGGTGGVPSRSWRSLWLSAEQAAAMAVAFDAHGVRHARHVFWRTTPAYKMLVYAKLGHETIAWLHPLSPLPVRVRVVSDYLALLWRLGGQRLPRPAFLDLRRPERLVAWLARQPPTGRPIVVDTTVSSAVRAAVAATAAGASLEHVTFYVQGEPVTPARFRHITQSGARVIASYGTIELATIGFGCAAPAAVDDVHLIPDRWATISRPRAVDSGGPNVDVLLFSSISRFASKIVLNADLGDYGRLERRACDCSMGRLGLHTHLSEVRSFEKLTGEGMTVVRTNLVQILEQVLPARFGGSSTDYQLLEQEGLDSATRLVLRVHPSVGDVDADAVRAAVLAGLRRGHLVSSFMTEMWRRADTVTVSREPPIVTAAGKMLPIHLLKPPPVLA
jgi:hypothetical protein